MKRFVLKAALAAMLAFAALPSQAEDIDLFVNANPNEADLPNVLFIMDNTANWNQAFVNEMAALVNTFNNLPDDKFRIGILFANETGDPNNNITGGYVRAAIRTMNATNKTKYATLIQNLHKLNDKGNGGTAALSMAEAYLYFSGGTPYGGNGKVKTDYTGNSCADCNLAPVGKAANAAVYALAGNALSSKNATRYNSPIPSGSCAKNFIIYISNGAAQDSSQRSEEANGLLAAAGGDTTQISLVPSGSQDNVSDEWARFMKTSALAITTYTVDVDPVTTGQGPGWTAVLKSMAAVSEGKYTAVSSGSGGSQISDAINRALSEIQSVNTVFASVSLPVSVAQQGSYLNQVFVGMFRPDSQAAPRWAGNLKQYKLSLEGSDVRTVDADGQRAINTSTGFITECARSFWTPTVVDNYWTFNPQGGCIPPPGQPSNYYKISNFPDGNVVEKGAAGHLLRSSSGRNLKTCPPIFTSCQNPADLQDFNTGNASITAESLAVSAAERDSLINWSRGLDVNVPAEKPGNTAANMRPSVHGDIVHSRPVAINFGTDAAPQVVVFYGGNDGVFRAINGNRSANIGSVEPGRELWSFIPPEFYKSLKRLRSNAPQIKFKNITSSDAQPKPYALDGAVTAYRDGSNAWIYTTMRRGGRVLYAFNVNVSDPSDIRLKWKRGCPHKGNDGDCSSGFSGIGETWSQPQIFKASGYNAGNQPLLIMGGGYDICEDEDPNTCGTSSKGRKIYVMDANTGVLLRTFDTDRPVMADVFVAPDLSTGLARYAYATDLGGNIYRITIGDAAPAAWSMTKIAALGCAVPGSCTNNRKFMFAPDVVLDGGKYVLLLGSGDREKPLVSYTGATSVSNYFFMIKDDPADPTWLTSETVNCGSAVICLASLLQIPGNSTTTPTSAELATKKGWYLGLRPTEQVVDLALTIFGVVTFHTHEPQATQAAACSNALGTTRVYNINYKDASPQGGSGSRYAELPPVGLPPSSVAGIVILDSGEQVAFCIGCSSESPLEAKRPTIPITVTPTEPKSRVYWYLEQ